MNKQELVNAIATTAEQMNRLASEVIRLQTIVNAMERQGESEVEPSEALAKIDIATIMEAVYERDEKAVYQWIAENHLPAFIKEVDTRTIVDKLLGEVGSMVLMDCLGESTIVEWVAENHLGDACEHAGIAEVIDALKCHWDESDILEELSEEGIASFAKDHELVNNELTPDDMVEVSENWSRAQRLHAIANIANAGC